MMVFMIVNGPNRAAPGTPLAGNAKWDRLCYPAESAGLIRLPVRLKEDSRKIPGRFQVKEELEGEK